MMTDDKIKAIREALELYNAHRDYVPRLATQEFVRATVEHLPGLLDELEAKTQTILRMGRMLAREGLVCTDGPDPVERELESLRTENEDLKRQVELSAYDGMGEDV